MASRSRTQQEERRRPPKVGPPKKRSAAKRQAKRGEAPVTVDYMNIRGEVLAADLRKMEFQLQLEDDTLIVVPFRPEHQPDVIDALQNHKTRRLQVVGEGEYRAEKLVRVVDACRIHLLPAPLTKRGTPHRPIEEELAEIAKEIPQEVWDEFPDDLSSQIDHYLYGWPKR